MKQTPRVGRKSTDKLSVGLPGQLGQSESAIAKGMYPPQLLSAGYGRHEWGDIHTWVAYFGIILAVVHLGVKLAVAGEGRCLEAHMATRRRYPLGASYRCRLPLVAVGESLGEKRKRCHSPAHRAVIHGRFVITGERQRSVPATTCVLIARTGQGTVRMDVLTSLNSDMQTVHLIKPQ
jgi:Domain of unknown function (DUF4405)